MLLRCVALLIIVINREKCVQNLYYYYYYLLLYLLLVYKERERERERERGWLKIRIRTRAVRYCILLYEMMPALELCLHIRSSGPPYVGLEVENK